MDISEVIFPWIKKLIDFRVKKLILFQPIKSEEEEQHVVANVDAADNQPADNIREVFA